MTERDRPDRLREYMQQMVRDPKVWQNEAAILSMHQTPAGDIYLQDAGLPAFTWRTAYAIGGTPVDVLEKLPTGLMIRQDIVRKNMPGGFFGWMMLTQAWLKLVDVAEGEDAFEEMKKLAGKVKDQPDKVEIIQAYGVSTDGVIVTAMEPRDSATFPSKKRYLIHRPDENGIYSPPTINKTRMFQAITKANRAIERIGAGK